MRTLKAEFTLPSLSDDIVINLHEINVFPWSYPFSNFHFNWRYKIWDFWLLFLLFRRQCSTVDPILSKKITLSLLTHRCLGVICLETDQCTIRGACKASSCMYGSEKLKESESYITWNFQNRMYEFINTILTMIWTGISVTRLAWLLSR